MKWPFIKFYARDWIGDPELRMCSLESRGCWLEMLLIMHSAKRRGYFETPQGHALSDEQASRIMATHKGDLIRCKEELLMHGIPSVDEDGVWYSRRMVKDTKKSELCSEAGVRGAKKKEAQRPETIIPETRNHISLRVTLEGQLEPIAIEALDDWVQHKRESGDRYNETALKALVSKFAAYPPGVVRQAVDASLANNWAGVYPDKIIEKPKDKEEYEY